MPAPVNWACALASCPELASTNSFKAEQKGAFRGQKGGRNGTNLSADFECLSGLEWSRRSDTLVALFVGVRQGSDGLDAGKATGVSLLQETRYHERICPIKPLKFVPFRHDPIWVS